MALMVVSSIPLANRSVAAVCRASYSNGRLVRPSGSVTLTSACSAISYHWRRSNAADLGVPSP